MSSQRPSFAKRDREAKLKDKARAKAERREARKNDPRATKGPPIAYDEAHVVTVSSDDDTTTTDSPEAPATGAPAPAPTP